MEGQETTFYTFQYNSVEQIQVVCVLLVYCGA